MDGKVGSSRAAAADCMARVFAQLQEHFDGIQIICHRTNPDGSTWVSQVDWNTPDEEESPSGG